MLKFLWQDFLDIYPMCKAFHTATVLFIIVHVRNIQFDIEHLNDASAIVSQPRSALSHQSLGIVIKVFH